MNKAKVSKSAVITAVATAGISALLCAALYIYEYLTDTCLFVFGIMDFHIYLIFGILFEISLAILPIIFIKSKRIKGLLIIAIIFISIIINYQPALNAIGSGPYVYATSPDGKYKMLIKEYNAVFTTEVCLYDVKNPLFIKYIDSANTEEFDPLKSETYTVDWIGNSIALSFPYSNNYDSKIITLQATAD